MTEKDDSLWSGLTKMIPGYGAYREQESRREDDRLTRDFLSVRIRECKSALDRLTGQAVEEGDFDKPSQLEPLHLQLDFAQNRIDSAVEGYAGWFNQRTVDTNLLDKIAELDGNLVSVVDQIDAQLKAAVEGQTPLDAITLRESIDLLHQRIDRRNELLRAGS